MTNLESSSLAELRQQLSLINQRLLGILKERRQVVASIQAEKKAQDLASFSVAQEKELFQNELFCKECRSLSTGELLAFSILWETQANTLGDYPAWSQRIHIEQGQLGLQFEEQMNPIMLKAIRPQSFAQLSLKPAYAYLKNL